MERNPISEAIIEMYDAGTSGDAIETFSLDGIHCRFTTHYVYRVVTQGDYYRWTVCVNCLLLTTCDWRETLPLGHWSPFYHM